MTVAKPDNSKSFMIYPAAFASGFFSSFAGNKILHIHISLIIIKASKGKKISDETHNYFGYF